MCCRIRWAEWIRSWLAATRPSPQPSPASGRGREEREPNYG
ncbi:hypothetical protein [Lysobacter gummosus]